MNNDFNELLYEYICQSNANIMLASQIGNEWGQILQNLFLKRFSDEIHKALLSKFSSNDWAIENAYAKDRYSKYLKFTISNAKWNSITVAFGNGATRMNEIYFGVTYTKESTNISILEPLQKRLGGKQEVEWYAWQDAREDMRNLSSSDGLIAINNGEAVKYYVEILSELVAEVHKLLNCA